MIASLAMGSVFSLLLETDPSEALQTVPITACQVFPDHYICRAEVRGLKQSLVSKEKLAYM